MNNCDYLLIIYTCKKNLNKALNLYNVILTNPINSTQVLIIYGDPNLNTDHVLVNNLLILKVGDNYENLTDKSFKLFNTIIKLFPNIKGIFKCDDDILINCDSLSYFIKKNSGHDYCGKIANIDIPYNSTHHYGKCSDIVFNKPYLTIVTKYCGGPLYYLSNKALQCFKEKYIEFTMFEDNAVGAHLKNFNIYPSQYDLYSDEINNINKISYHNNSKDNIIFVRGKWKKNNITNKKQLKNIQVIKNIKKIYQ